MVEIKIEVLNMEIKHEKNIRPNGSYEESKTVKTTKEDGWVEVGETLGEKKNIYEKRFFKGKSFSYQYETNDPNITRPFTRFVGISMMIIGVILAIVGIVGKSEIAIFFGVMIVIISIGFLINTQKQIKEIENKLKEEKKDDNNTE